MYHNRSMKMPIATWVLLIALLGWMVVAVNAQDNENESDWQVIAPRQWINGISKVFPDDHDYNSGWYSRYGKLHYFGLSSSQLQISAIPVKDYKIEMSFTVDRESGDVSVILPTQEQYKDLHFKAHEMGSYLKVGERVTRIPPLKINQKNHLMVNVAFPQKRKIDLSIELNGELVKLHSGYTSDIVNRLSYHDNVRPALMIGYCQAEIDMLRIQGWDGTLKVKYGSVGTTFDSRLLAPEEVADAISRKTLYQPPDLKLPWFDTTNVGYKGEYKELVEKLCDFMQYDLKYTHKSDYVLASHMLGLALRLVPDHERALLLNSQFSRGMTVRLKDRQLPRASKPLLKYLRSLELRMGNKYKPVSKQLACYINHLTLEIIPEDKQAIWALIELEKQGYHGNWKGVGMAFQGGLLFGEDEALFDTDEWNIRNYHGNNNRWYTTELPRSKHKVARGILSTRPASFNTINYLIPNRWVLDGDFELVTEIKGATAFGVVAINGLSDRHIMAEGKSDDWHRYSVVRTGKSIVMSRDGRPLAYKQADLVPDEAVYFAALMSQRDPIQVRYFQLSSPPGAFPSIERAQADIERAIATYKETRFQSPVFPVVRKELHEHRCDAIADVLAGYVSRQLKYRTVQDVQIASELIGLAKAFAPKNKAAVVAHAQLRAGHQPVSLGKAKSITSSYIGILMADAQRLRESGSPAQHEAARYLVEAMAKINPQHPDVVYQQEMLNSEQGEQVLAAQQYSTKQTEITTSGLTTTDIQNSDQEIDYRGKIYRRQSAIKGLVVQTIANGQRIGFSTDIILTVARPQHKQVQASTQILGEIGSQMRTALDEAARLTSVEYPKWENGIYRFSFGEKYSSKDGGSAGGAFAVLFRSVFDNFVIDPNMAMTGDITVDGKIRSVGAVATKVRGAKLDGLQFVGIPSVNEQSVPDIILLEGYSAAADIQIFGLETIDDAIALARIDRNESTQKAIQLFYTFSEEIKKNKRAYLDSAQAVEQLEEIVSLAPNHLSAKYLLMLSSGSHPRKLSFSGTMQETFNASFAVQDYLWNSNRRIHRSSLTRDDVKQMHKQLRKLTVLGSRDAQKLIKSLIGFVTTCDRYASGKMHPNVFEQKRIATLKVVQELVTDRQKMERLMREGR